MSGTSTATITMTVSAPSREAVYLAIRATLKTMLRTYGVRCLSVALADERQLECDTSRRSQRAQVAFLLD